MIQPRPIKSKNGDWLKYEDALGRIEALGHTKNLSELERFAHEIEFNWDHWKDEDYFSLILFICDTLNSTSFSEDDKRVALRQKHAVQALGRPVRIPLESQLLLLVHAQQDSAFSTKAGGRGDWPNRRRQMTEAWVRLGQRIDQELNKDFDFHDVPQENIALPPGASGLAGMSPERIEDPGLRAEYEAAIERNEQKSENYRKQRKLRDLNETFHSKAEQYLINAYGKPPFDFDELANYLESHVADREEKERIVEAVKQQRDKSSG